MNRLPVHIKMGLPIPAINVFGFQKYDFTTINEDFATALAQRERCGICAEKMGDEVAFLGGGKSAEAGTYTDPPMHPACAEAAVALCPHINRKNMKRAPDHRLQEGVMTPDIMVLDKPDTWVMKVVAAGDFQITRHEQDGLPFIVYFAGDEVRRKEWVYNDEGRITPVNMDTGEIADLVASAEFEGGTPSERAQGLAQQVLDGELTGDEAAAQLIEGIEN